MTIIIIAKTCRFFRIIPPLLVQKCLLINVFSFSEIRWVNPQKISGWEVVIMILRSNFLFTVPNVKSEKLEEKDMKAKRDGDL